MGAVMALLVHEWGHWLASRLMGERIDALKLTPFGGVMIYQEGKSPSKGIRGICIACAGPAANYLFLMIAGRMTQMFNQELLRSIVLSNAAMLFVNMLPALPLDGGRALFSLGYYVFPFFRLISWLSWIGVAAGACFLILSIYGLISLGKLNCSLVIVGTYLIYSAWKSRAQMMIENLYTVIQEKEDTAGGIRPRRVYEVATDVQLIRLVPYLGGEHVCEFVFSDGDREYRMTQKLLQKHLLERPMAEIGDIFQ